MTVTATIRVPRETRDRLAARARERGVSLSSLLTEFARRAERADADNRDVAAEEAVWEAVLGDGLD